MNRLEQAVAKNGGATILGAAAYMYNPTFLEIAALVGFKAAWIEMEHTFLTIAQAVDLCRIASGLGMLTMIRIPDTRRATVLQALECGPDMLDIPMANSPETIEEYVHHAKFPPEGVRGWFSVSRAVHYGLNGPVPEVQAKLNQEICLIAQVETAEAVDRVEELCAVPGLDGIFVGPGDLSASLGVPGQTRHDLVLKAAERTFRVAKACGKQTATAVAPQEAQFWLEQGVDLLYVINDTAAMKAGAQSAMQQTCAAMEKLQVAR